MKITITDEDEARLIGLFAHWSHQVRACMNIGDTTSAKLVDNWLFGAEQALKMLDLPGLAKIAHDAQASRPEVEK